MRMVNAKEAMKITGFGKSKFYQMFAEGKFPACKRIGTATRWPDYIPYGFAILYWELEDPMPTMPESSLAELQNCIARAKALCA